MTIIKRLKQSILFKNTSIYKLLKLINSAIPFLLLSQLTHYLNTPNALAYEEDR